MYSMFTTIVGIVIIVGICSVLFAANVDTGSPTTTGQTQNEPTELDAEYEAHIDSFEDPASTNKN